MSIFLDPSAVPIVPSRPEASIDLTDTPTFDARNYCPPAGGCEGGDCAPLPYLGNEPGIAQGPGCIIVDATGKVTAPESLPPRPTAGQLTDRPADNAYLNKLAYENLSMGGANACVFKMLGVKQQGTLIDAAGFGTAIASDSVADFPPANAFDRFAAYYLSDAAGTDLLKSYLGYDFGVVKRSTGLQEYSTEGNAEARKHITSLAIRQGPVNHRVLRARVERSDDGIRWFGVDIINLPDTSERSLVAIKTSVPSRMWRLTPTTPCSDRWIVDTLELFEFIQTDISNVQDNPLFQENRDRSYCVNPVKIKLFYDLIDINTELARFGIDLPSATMSLTVHFSEAVRQLGRGIVIGDVFEIPSEIQFTANMSIVRKYVEVTDVSWSTSGYTPGWVPLFQRITARPMLARQETIDLVGSLEPDIGAGGLGFDSMESIFSTLPFQSNERIQIAADTQNPQIGTDEQTIAALAEIPQQHIDTAAEHGINIAKLTTSANTINVTRTAMPPASTPPEMFGSGDHANGFPQNPKNNQYFRMTYDSITADSVPPRLYRYSLAKNRWVYLETDERWSQTANKGRLKSYLVDADKIDLRDIDK